MAVVCLASASGSPGVTTTAVGLAFCWPRPVLLVEADPTGGSGILAGFLKGTTAYDVGLIELVLSPLGVTDALRDVVRPLSPNVSLVAGTRTHAQATALRDVWEPLAAALSELEASGQDVIVDAGRLGLTGSPQPLLEAADLTLLMTRATLPSISAVRSWAEAVRQPATGWRHPGLLLIGEGRPYRDTEVSKVLGMPVVADLPDDPEAAAVYHRGATPPRHFETGPYVRSLQAAVQSIQAQVARGRAALVEESAR
jgi:hypothetical protein